MKHDTQLKNFNSPSQRLLLAHSQGDSLRSAHLTFFLQATRATRAYLIFCVLTKADKPEKCMSIQLSPIPPGQQAPLNLAANSQPKSQRWEGSHPQIQDINSVDGGQQISQREFSQYLHTHFIQLQHASFGGSLRHCHSCTCVKYRGEPNEVPSRTSPQPDTPLSSPHGPHSSLDPHTLLPALLPDERPQDRQFEAGAELALVSFHTHLEDISLLSLS